MTNYKPSRMTFENESYKTQILDLLINSKDPMTATEVGYQIGISTQKAAALLNQMKFIDGIVVTHCKNKLYYEYGTAPTSNYYEKEAPTFVFTTSKPKEEPKEESLDSYGIYLRLIAFIKKMKNYFNPPLD